MGWMMPVSLLTSIVETSDVLLSFNNVSKALRSIVPLGVTGIIAVFGMASITLGCSIAEMRICSFGYCLAK